MTVEIELLGPLTVRIDGRTVPASEWRRRDAAALVKVLALAPGRGLHREQLMDRLWPDVGTDEAGPRLHKATHFARRTLQDAGAVVLRDDMVMLFPDQVVGVDAESWQAAAEAALASGDPSSASAVVDTLPTEPMPSDLYEPWAAPTRDRLVLLRDRLLRQAARWNDLLTLDPTDEDAHLSLMTELLSAGDPAAALSHYEHMVAVLERELGVEPGPAARRLRDEILGAQERRAMPATHPTSAPGRLQQRIRFCRTQDGVSIAYASTGAGPPLVKAANWLTHLDHDWHSPVWRHWLIGLSQNHELIRYDERGCGLSDWDLPEDGATFETWVHDLETVIDATGHEQVDLLGISQGGGVAVTYAARHPERVRRLVLYGAFAQGRGVAADTEEQREIFQTQLQLARVGWGHDSPVFRQVFTAQFMPSASRELWDAFNDLQRLTTSADNAARLMEVSGHIDVTEIAPEVQAPALVLHARNDQRPPFTQGRMLATLLPDSRFVTLESDNHILLADEPAWPQFLAEVEAFLE